MKAHLFVPSWRQVLTVAGIPWFASRLAFLILLLAVVALLGGCARKPPKQVAPAAPPYDPVALQAKSQELARQLVKQKPQGTSLEYEIGPTDILEISVFEVPKYTVVARVGGDGSIRFPDLGIVKVGGLSERKAEDLLQRLLKQKELVMEPQVAVFVKELHAKEVTVAGEVKAPGVYPIRGNESMIDVVSKAGGLSPNAGSYAYVLRAPKAGDATTSASNIKVDLVAMLMRGEAQWNIPLQTGDRVTIPPVGWIHITGKGIEKAGTYMLRSNPNLLRQSIDDAGGLKFEASHHLLIVRRSPDGRQETFSVDFSTIEDDENNDITVQGSDTVIVNRDGIKVVLRAIGVAFKETVRFTVNLGGYVPLWGDSYYGGGY